jgi:hypothetical protein
LAELRCVFLVPGGARNQWQKTMVQSLHSETFTEQCLDCRIDGRKIAVPVTHVDQLIDYDCKPLPLARFHVAGLGIFAGNLLVSLSLCKQTTRHDTHTLAVLFRGLPGSTPWALEVDKTFSFIDVVRRAGAASERSDEPWLDPADLATGGQLEWLDVERFVTSLIDVRPSR